MLCMNLSLLSFNPDCSGVGLRCLGIDRVATVTEYAAANDCLGEVANPKAEKI